MYGWVGSDRRSTEEQKMSETRAKEQATCGAGKAKWNEAAALTESASDGAVPPAEKSDQTAESKGWLGCLGNLHSTAKKHRRYQTAEPAGRGVDNGHR